MQENQNNEIDKTSKTEISLIELQKAFEGLIIVQQTQLDLKEKEIKLREKKYKTYILEI